MRRLAQAQGVFNVVSGVWPLVSMRTFEAVYGPKNDRWLVHTVAGLLTTVGCAQLLSRNPVQLRVARVVGIGTAATLLTIDAVYVPKRRISRMYLQDAVCELGWLAGWAWVSRPRRAGRA
ncbi:hypothetical protein GCM10009740_20740 [Terrabacter terrae]|uniref:Uncharacterized protein n=1 Tax=Terrabacter terrae TaxID=318434 RepID=A0ABP5FNX3_9MICO